MESGVVCGRGCSNWEVRIVAGVVPHESDGLLERHNVHQGRNIVNERWTRWWTE